MHCPYCNKYFSTKKPTIDHMVKVHAKELEKDDMDAYQKLFYNEHGRLYSYCLCGCGKRTEWNFKTGKPYKLSTDPECKKRIAAQADARNIKVYGKPKLLDDMARQKTMLKNRHISGKYKFSDGGEVDYVAKLEQNFLWFLDTMLEFTSNMVLSADQHNIEIEYFDEKEQKTRTYIPDFYLPDYNALVEIKSSNTNPTYIKETAYKEKYKEDAMRKQTKYNYIKIIDAKYGPFIEFLAKIVGDDKASKTKVVKTKTYIVTESASMAEDDVPMYETVFPGMHVAVAKDPILHRVTAIAISESSMMGKLYVTDEHGLRETTFDDPVFDDDDIEIYRYAKSKANSNKVLRSIIDVSETECNENGLLLIEQIFSDFNINYHFDETFTTDNRMSDFIKLDTIKARGGIDA